MSYSGINDFKSNRVNYAISFYEPICPVCGKFLFIDESYNYRIRYSCKCGFTCPLYHESQDPTKIRPIYDTSIVDFINSLGKTIQERRLEAIMKTRKLF